VSKILISPTTHEVIGGPTCPLCAKRAEVYQRKDGTDLFEGSCPRCGDICISLSAADYARRQDKAHLIAAWLRRRPGSEPPMMITEEGVSRILRDIPEYSVLEKLDLTLSVISSLTGEPGQNAKFLVGPDYPLIFAKSQDEAAFYIRELASLGYLEEQHARAGVAKMLARGYQHLLEINRAGRQSSFAFVAMWFDPSMNEVYDEGIEPAIRESGYKSLRIDRVQHANRIDDEIIGRIKGSHFMVADFTGQRAGVYFEAGLMLGLGRTVIWMCRREELKNIHFDTRQYNFIDYENVAEAKKRLYDRVIAIEGEGPGALAAL
jgi:hypothetical protein